MKGHPIRKIILFEAVDCFGELWHVAESRPTEHDWNILLGYPAVHGVLSKGITALPKVILTPELRAYLEEFRMNRGKMRLPLSASAITRLRRQLGMNYARDCKTWWDETKNMTISTPSSSPQSDTFLKPSGLTWSRDEIKQAHAMLTDGRSISEIAETLGKKESAILTVRGKILGRKILSKAVDCFGERWNVIESVPTEHSWNLLFGFPAVHGFPVKGRMGSPQVILTLELRAYLEELRMTSGKARLSLSNVTISKLRRRLGMKSRRRKWSSDEISQIHAMLNDGRSISEIAETVGRSEKVILKFWNKLFGPKISFWTPEEEERLIEGARHNVPDATIAKNLNRPLSSIQNKLAWLKKMGRWPLGLKVPRWTSEEEEKLIEGAHNKVSLATIAKDLNRSLVSVRSKLTALRKTGRDFER